MHTCSCGREAEDAGKLCARCAALQALDLDAQASEKQIRDAYRTLVKVWHPDRFEGDAKLRQAAEEKVKALNAAYVFLTAKEDFARRPRPARPAARPARAHARPHPRSRMRFRFPAAGLFKLALLGCGLLVAAVFLMGMDSFFASDPTTGPIYSQVRAHVMANARQTADAVWSQAGEHMHAWMPANGGALPVAAAPDSGPQAEETLAQNSGAQSTPQSLHRREPGASRAETVRLQPYITAGLSKEEVIAVLGAPTSSTESKLAYGASELDFTNGKLSGWKIAASAPIHVKLWPDAPVDPTLTYFKVGSTKNEVLVVQGTPSYFSANTFGYGGSMVYFENGRVVSWKNDSSTVPLRVTP
jgi:hypothetical protein